MPFLRTLLPQDLDQVVVLDHLGQSGGWTKSQYKPFIENNSPACAWVLVENTFIKGLLCAQILPFEAELQNLVIHHECRRKGYAQLLLDKFIKCCLERSVLSIFLEVRAQNEPAIQLYSKIGFTRNGERKNYYTDGQNALLMQYILPPYPQGSG